MNENNLSTRDVCGLIITYNGIECIEKTILSTMKAVDKIVIVDNCSTDGTIEYLEEIKSEKINIILLGRNYGIAKALNTGFSTAITLGYLWVLTLDQDSYLSTDMMYKMLSNYPNIYHEKIGIICPQITYQGEKKLMKWKKIEYLKTTITSGNIVSVTAFNDVNGFEEKLFIDNVDFDFCLKLISKEYRIIRVNDAFLDHKLGNLKKVKIFGILFHIHTHNNARKYYMSRNHIYLTRKYFFSQTQLILKLNIFFALFIFQVILFENNKCESLKSILSGLKDGLINNFESH